MSIVINVIYTFNRNSNEKEILLKYSLHWFLKKFFKNRMEEESVMKTEASFIKE